MVVSHVLCLLLMTFFLPSHEFLGDGILTYEPSQTAIIVSIDPNAVYLIRQTSCIGTDNISTNWYNFY